MAQYFWTLVCYTASLGISPFSSVPKPNLLLQNGLLFCSSLLFLCIWCFFHVVSVSLVHVSLKQIPHHQHFSVLPFRDFLTLIFLWGAFHKQYEMDSTLCSYLVSHYMHILPEEKYDPTAWDVLLQDFSTNFPDSYSLLQFVHQSGDDKLSWNSVWYQVSSTMSSKSDPQIWCLYSKQCPWATHAI